MADCLDHPLKPRKPKEDVDSEDDTAESASENDAKTNRQENSQPDKAGQGENDQGNTEKEKQFDDSSRIDREENAQARDNGQFVNNSRMLTHTDSERDENLQVEMQQGKNENSEKDQVKDGAFEKTGKGENCLVRKERIKSDRGDSHTESEPGPDVKNPKDEETNPISLNTPCGTFNIVSTAEQSTKVRTTSLVLSY